MNVAKFIRILGYAVYVILWSPVIALIVVALPIWTVCTCIKNEYPITSGFVWLKESLKNSIAHDMHFIKTGVW